MFWLAVPGWIGAISVLVAFWLLTHKVVHSHSKTYLGLNLLAGIMLGAEGFTKGSFSVLVVNVVWSLIAVYGLFYARHWR